MRADSMTPRAGALSGTRGSFRHIGARREGDDQAQNPPELLGAPQSSHNSVSSSSRPGGEEVGFQVAFGEFLPCWVTSRPSLVRAASAFSPAIVFASSTAA